MSFSSGSTKNLPQPTATPFGLDAKKTATNEQANPLPVVFGTHRIAPTFVSDAFNQRAKPVKEDVGKEDVVTGYNYYCDFAAVLCHGPVSRIDEWWHDNVKVWPTSGSGITRDTTRDKIISIDVRLPGKDYTEATVAIDGDGTGAEAIALIDGGKVKFILMTNWGEGYSEATATIDGDGTGASLKCNIGSEPYVNITLPTGGTVRFYWGTEEQDIDPHLTSLSADPIRNPGGPAEDNPTEEHPAYTGQCYFVAQNFALGYQRTQVPNIEIILGVNPDGTGADTVEVDKDCSVGAAVLASMRNSRYGLGMDASRFNLTEINAANAELVGEDLAFSPVIDRVQPFLQILIQYLEYFDAFYRFNGDGKFSIGLTRALPCADEHDIPMFDESSLVDLPDVDPGSWQDTQNQIFVAFVNRETSYLDDATPAPNSGNYVVTNERNTLVLQRPWITKLSTADIVARVASRAMGYPACSGTIKVRKSKLQGVQPGDLFHLNYASWGLCWLRCRAQKITVQDPYSPEVEIQFAEDPGSYFERTTSLPTFTAPVKVAPAPAPIVNARVLEMPYWKEVGEVAYVAVLAARPTSMINRTTLWYEADPDVSRYAELKTFDKFAFYGTLDLDYLASDTGTLQFTLSGVDLDLPSAITEIEADKDTYLLFIGDEIISVWDPVLITGNTYTVQAKRERFDTALGSHTAGAQIFIISLNDLKLNAAKVTFDHPADEAVNFKLQPSVLGTKLDLSETDPISVTFQDRVKRPWKPRTLTAPGTFNGTASVSISWTLNNRDGGQFQPGTNVNPLYLLQFFTASHDLVFTETLKADQTGYTLTMARLTAEFGSLQDFYVQISATMRSYGSLTYAEVFCEYLP